jgi:predicted RNase H-like nuclease
MYDKLVVWASFFKPLFEEFSKFFNFIKIRPHDYILISHMLIGLLLLSIGVSLIYAYYTNGPW